MASLHMFSLIIDLVQGTITSSIGNLQKLTYLKLICRLQDAVLPLEIGNLASLQHLELQLDSLVGPLPDTLVRLKALIYLRLQLRSSIISNPDVITLPEALGDLVNLEKLVIYGDISGTLPRSIGRLKQLQELFIINSAISGPLPSEIGQLRSLQVLEIPSCQPSSRGMGSIPTEIGNLINLTSLSLSCRVNGTIPSSISSLQKLRDLLLLRNFIEGTIPTLPRTIENLDLSQNLLTDWFDDNPLPFIAPDKFVLRSNRIQSIPRIIMASPPSHFDVSYNNISGTLPDDFFINTGSGIYTFYSNRLTGLLPSKLSNRTSFASLRLELNDFYGPIPAAYGLVSNLVYLGLDKNRLTGNLEGWDAIRPLDRPTRTLVLSASNNHLSGQLVPLNKLINLGALHLSGNQITGSLPSLPSSLTSLSLANNRLQSFGASFSPNVPYLTNIDLSNNQITGTIPSNMISQEIVSLNMKNNSISGAIPWLLASNLVNLDLSFNRITGELPTNMQAVLGSLDLRSNQMTGQILQPVFPQINHLDIAFNKFELHTSAFAKMPRLVTLDASNNRISGNPSDLASLSFIKMADLSVNQLDQDIQIPQLHKLFTTTLRQLYINHNPNLLHIQHLSPEFGPWRTAQSQPSVILPYLADCFSLTFDNDSSTLVFVFDETLFNYQQCDCMNGYYGIPPSTCYTCPPQSSCKANTLAVKHDIFVFSYTTESIPYTTGNLVDNTRVDGEHLLGHNGAVDSLLETEDCIVSLAATESNCLGLNLTFEHGASSSSDVLELFNSRRQSQCSVGSSGRLCSRCDCDLSTQPDNISLSPQTYEQSSPFWSSSSSSPSISSCFYKRGFKCSRCSTTFTLSQSIPLAVGIVVGVFIILTIVMTIVLRGRRQVRYKRWEDLPVLKRIWYRLVDSSKSGLISILVLFIQILVALTHWDAFLLRTLAQMMNGSVESIGLVCLFPSLLTHPMASLALQLTLPLMVSALATLSVGCGHLLSLWIDHRSSSSSSNFDSDFSDMDDSSSTSGLLEQHGDSVGSRSSIDYPALALVSSTTISILQFFYFGTSLAAVEYFFSSVQSHSGLKYVQAHPWMLYDEARSLRGLSIPWLLIVVIGFPISFIVFAFHVRHKSTSPGVTKYIGSLFSRYRHRVFWWEIVNVLKKLTIALLIRGISAANPMQVASITLSIGIPILVQSAVRPWKRYWENVMDSAGSILLISSLGASNSIRSTGSLSVLYLVLTLDGIYVGTMIVMIIYQLVTSETEYQYLWKVTFGQTELLSDDLAQSRDTSITSPKDSNEYFDGSIHSLDVVLQK
jgi:Leucine-rich repeat (LRR) protein